jgi:hypothetical protein
MLRLIEFKLSKLMVLNKSTMKFGQYSCSNTFSTGTNVKYTSNLSFKLYGRYCKEDT